MTCASMIDIVPQGIAVEDDKRDGRRRQAAAPR